MSFSNFIALRYLSSSRENRFFSWITFLSITGMAIGVAALIVVLSVINGFEHELRSRFLHANAHIMAYRYPAGMVEPEKWASIIRKDFKDEVKGISPFIHYESMIKHGSIMQGVLVRGISPRKREKVQSLGRLVQPPGALDKLQAEIDLVADGEALPAAPGLILGSGMIKIIDAKIGDTVYMVSPDTGGSPELAPFTIIGTYHSGLKHYDNRLAALSIVSAGRFFKMGEVVTGLEIGLHDDADSIEVEKQMRDKYNLTFREWQSFNRPLFEAMEKERVMIAVIVAMVVLVAAFNILTTVFVSVSQKQKDISILKAIGASNRQIIRLFLNQGVYIGVIGGAVGGVLALIISWLLQTYNFIDLPDPYFLKQLPVHYSPLVYISVIASAVVLCIVAGLYPAIIAARVNPGDGFRGTGNAL